MIDNQNHKFGELEFFLAFGASSHGVLEFFFLKKRNLGLVQGSSSGNHLFSFFYAVFLNLVDSC